MKLNEYQQMALETAHLDHDQALVYLALGLNGESGEVADKVKKVIRDCGGEWTEQKKHEVAQELGDVLWYLAVFTSKIGYSLETIAAMNYAKLQDRVNRGVLGGSGDNR
jgi:NTP pyrophosphatase (non-canonical NTP hydrolase)